VIKRFETGAHGAGGFTSLVLQDTYTLGACIGRGGMGEVYEATHARLPGRMAVKILRPHLRTNLDAFARFCREAEIMSAVRHPHIIKIFDFNTSPALDGLPYFVMEYLDGVDLERRLADFGPLPIAATIRIADAVASALAAAHAAGVVHRDLKPANIFLMRGEGKEADFVKVIDFGISTSRGSGPSPSNPSDVFGTPPFMAPEQAMGLVHKVDARADQFALAAITYAMLTGREPFVGDNAASLLYQVVHKRHPPLSRFVCWDTTSIQPVLDRALAKQPEDRFEGVVEFTRALSAAAQARTVGPVMPFGDADLSGSIDRVPRRPQRAVALGLAIVGLAAFIGYKGWSHRLGGRTVNAEQDLISRAGEKWRAFKRHGSVAAPQATALPTASREIEPVVKVRSRIGEEVPPPAPASGALAAAGERSAPHRPEAARVPTRQLLLRHRSPARSEWQSIQIISLPPSSAPEAVADSAGPEAPAPPAAANPEPAPAPPTVDLAPPTSALNQTNQGSP
jgi:serine/threonine protein kinase